MKPRTGKTAANMAWISKWQRWCSTIRTIAREQDRIVNGEARWQTIGLVNELLLVCHTWTEEDVVRIVSARKANRTERNRYYHGHRPL